MDETALSRRSNRVVSSALSQLVRHQVAAHGLVVWFDPERQYETILPELDLGGAELRCYGGSFFALRHEIEPLLQDEQPPRLVVYVPMAAADTNDALVEAVAAGVTIYPGANPWQRNTRLAVVVDHALRDRIGEQRAAYLARQVEAGHLVIDDVDRLVELDPGGDYPSLALIFGTGDPLRIARDFLSTERQDRALVDRGALADLTVLLAEHFGIGASQAPAPSALRERLAAQTLVTDLRTRTGEPLPALAALVEPSNHPAAQAACRELASEWRNSRDLRESYVVWATRLEWELQVSTLVLSREALEQTETFACLEESLQRAIERGLAAGSDATLLHIAERRRSGFWSDVDGEIQARWSLIATAGRLLLEAERVETALRGRERTIETLIEGYTGGEQPWCLLDSEQRNLERQFHLFMLDPVDRHAHLEQLVTRARQRYMEVASALAERFVRAYEAAGFAVAGVLSQRQIFSHSVAPALKPGKVAYVLVDALRFEMARDLVRRLGDQYSVALQPAIAVAPTITEAGMAALLPAADQGMRLLAAGESKLAAEIGGTLLRDRAGRLAYLKDYAKAHAGTEVFEAKLGDLLPLKPAARARIGAAGLVVVTSQEIDELCERDNIEAARRQMDDVLGELVRAFQVLAGLGVQTIVLSADHGFIFGDELDEGMKVDPPGGEAVGLHRRVWIGRGGADSPAYLRAPLARFGVESSLELATPWGFGGFRVRGGARAYFHGGLSPQELIVPVAVLLPAQARGATPRNGFEWVLQPGREKITTRFCSVQVSGRARQFIGIEAPAVRVELKSGSAVVSEAVSASYGFDDATRSMHLRFDPSGQGMLDPDTVALMLTREPPPASVSIHLVDAASGAELARSGPIDVTIAF